MGQQIETNKMAFREEEKAGVYAEDEARYSERDAKATKEDKKGSRRKLLRKASVGVAGAGMLAVGVAGLKVLATEFESAKKVEKQLTDSTRSLRSEIKSKVLEAADSVRSSLLGDSEKSDSKRGMDVDADDAEKDDEQAYAEA